MPPEPFDHIANRIREATDQMDHPFDEAAWERMEAKLDEREDRKRPLIWFVPLLITGLLGIGYLVWNTWKDNKPDVISANQPTGAATIQTENKGGSTATTDQPASASSSNAVSPSFTDAPSSAENKLPESVSSHKEKLSSPESTPVAASDHSIRQNPTKVDGQHARMPIGQSKPASHLVHSNRSKNAASRQRTGHQTSTRLISDEAATQRTATRTRKVKSTSAVAIQTATSGAEEYPEKTPTDPVAPETTLAAPSIAPETKQVLPNEEKQNTQPTAVATDSTQSSVPSTDSKSPVAIKNKRPQSRGFYVLGASGIEVNGVRFLSTTGANTVSRVGLGLGYRLNNRISVQTGLYYSNKKYEAGATDYKLDNDPYWNHVQLLHVNAQCRMYEVPLEVKYDWYIRKNNRWFATTGLASYFIQREQYHYEYKKYNNYYESDEAYSGNKAIFSIATLSVGWEHSFNQRLSGFAQSFLRIPLSGVGDGSVKLHSFGLQVGVLYQLKK